MVCGICRANFNKIRANCKPIRASYNIPAMMSKILRAIYQVQRTVCKVRRLLNYCENQRAKGCMILPISKQCSYKLQVKVPFTKWKLDMLIYQKNLQYDACEKHGLRNSS